ncbi:MAG: saccharopine dehydrogenase C-terminal domain-containing protein [Sediminibacterium sp.]|nr:saccharopine dehydrogenase C-terminal domain-containing protein [Sediminibacterium sp.]
MNETKHILLFGAGKSATVLIDYLKQIATAKKWQVTIADVNLAAVQSKVGNHVWVKAVGVSIENDSERKSLISKADVVISLLPPTLHYQVALDCIAFEKHLLTASYVDDTIKVLADQLKAKGILFLCEMGLDPGIDHMSAMQLIHRIKKEGGRIHSFLSHCGGLVAPESDDNPWHYKISWNPRNVVMAGKAGAVYKEKSKVKSQNYDGLFADCSEVFIEGLGKLAYYPNRDSLSYIPVYALEEADTFIRTTLRHPDFCKGWQLIVQLGLTDEEKMVNTDGLTIAAFLQKCFSEKKIRIDADDHLLQEQFRFLGLQDESLLNKGICSYADILQSILERKWILQLDDKDMIVMLHEIGYEVNGQKSTLKSTLVVKGEDYLRTAMAKTVGLPLGIAATLLLEGKITETGLHIPIVPGIYEPVLEALIHQGIQFSETITHV